MRDADPRTGIHTVGEGETISSIGAYYGITDWEDRIWNDAQNSQLQQQRGNPNTLVPGDNVFIPELEDKQESRPTDAWHDFHVVRNKRFLRIKLQDENGEPLAGKTYKLTPLASFRGNYTQQGTTTGTEGEIEEQIPHTMTEADLSLPDEGLRVRLKIGFLHPLPTSDPIKLEIAGVDPSAELDSLAGQGQGLLDQVGSGAGSVGLGGVGEVSGSISGGLGDVQQTAQDTLQDLGPAVSAAAPLVNAVAGFLGMDSLLEVEDPNIYPASQRLESLGYDPGHPRDGEATPQFTAALIAFQTWCKQQGAMSQGAGGLLGSVGGGIGGMLLSKIGLTGNLDDETKNALRDIHGC